MALAASWLTSGWIDVAMILGWMALVTAIGVIVWRRGDRDAAAKAPRAPGPLVRLLGWLIVVAAVAPRLRRRGAR
jgi:hypothetical protein